MRHPVLECIPARAATHPPKQPATQEPAESQAASRAPSSAPGEAQHQQPQQEEQTTSTLNSPPFTRASARRPRGKQPRPKTSVARNNYAGFRSRQSPARPKHRYNAIIARRSSIYARLIAFSWRRGPAASNQGQKPA